jgi:hypothetical protein
MLEEEEMAEKANVAEKVTEAPEERLPIGDAPFQSTDEAAVEPEVESTEEAEVSTEAEEIAESIKPGMKDAAPEEEATEEGDVERLLREDAEAEEKPSNVQKRIDKLTAELKAAQEELRSFKGQKETARSPEYTPQQLRQAMKKSLEDGDADLAMDIFDYQLNKMKNDLIKMYTDEREMSVKQQQAIQNEWNDTVSAYDKYADTKVPAIWPTSHKDLNLRDSTSLLYQVALALYTSSDPEKARYYRQPGGQKLAVADALTRIVRDKAGKGRDSKVKQLEKKLTKERMKKSPVSGVAGAEERPAKRQTDDDRLAEVIAERKKYQSERES